MEKMGYIEPKVDIIGICTEVGFASSGNFEQPRPGSNDPFSGSAWD
jgi:hypothetical protein